MFRKIRNWCQRHTKLIIIIIIIPLLVVGGIYWFYYQPQQHSSTPITQTPHTQRTITVTNTITPEMLLYKHWTGVYNPSTFIVRINDTEIKQAETHIVTITNDTLKIRFDYSFLNGRRTGGRILAFSVNKKTKNLSFAFSWLDRWQILINDATPIDSQKVSFRA